MRRRAACGFVALVALACRSPAALETSEDAAAAPPDPRSSALESLRRRELSRLAELDPTRLPGALRDFGPDPYAIAVWPHGPAPRFVGVLRGESALVLLDERLSELSRAPVPPSPTGLAVAGDGRIWVGSELVPKLSGYRVTDSGLSRDGELETGELLGLRSIAARGDLLYAVGEWSGTLLGIDARRGTRHSIATGCSSVFRVLDLGSWLGVSCLHDHAFRVFALNGRGLVQAPAAASVVHDGPIWAADAIPDGDGLLLALAGVEDHPLDRTIGSFGYIDSYVYLYRFRPGAPATRLAAVNVSEHGVVTPKTISLQRRGDLLVVESAGYGSGALVELVWTEPRWDAPRIATRRVLPGLSSWVKHGAGWLGADPLFDAWLSSERPLSPVPVAAERQPSPLVRLGEAAFFTTLMGPYNYSDGPKSRFSCETCHFEGYTDGRIHHTGRGQVRVTTKPLLGLVNNRPYFSRAVDHDLTEVVDNEFEVASRGGGHPAWFSVSAELLPWIGALAPERPTLDPRTLREALLEFLIAFNHRPNPKAWGRTRFSELERRGAAAFLESCERCHAARLLTTDAGSRVPPERWEELVLAPAGAIVWGRSDYEKTGIEPYVHERGARVPSLRRLYKKRPYFTNGSAATLEDVVSRVRLLGTRFAHDPRNAAPELAPLPEHTRAALVAFLELL